MSVSSIAHLTPQSRELVSRLYSSNEYSKREAIYRILFDRRQDLLPELKNAIKFEKNEQTAVFMVQVAMTLSTFPRDSAMEKRILEILQYEEGGGVNDLAPTMWKYLENCATSQMIVAILGAMGNSIPANGYDFIEMCLTHPDPDVRAMVCDKAIKSGRPTHFAYVLNLVMDKDPIVSQTAFCAIKDLPEAELCIMIDYALGSPDEWVLNTVAPFLPNIITNSLRPVVSKVQYHSNKLVAQKAREALKILDAIPYVTKRTQKDREEAEKRRQREAEELRQKKEMVTLENGATVSLKEQMEMKRKEKEEEDRKRNEAMAMLEKDLKEVKDEDIADFAREVETHDSILPIEQASESIKEEEPIPSTESFQEDKNFSEEADILADIDEMKAEIAMEELLKESSANSNDNANPNTSIDENIDNKEVKESDTSNATELSDIKTPAISMEELDSLTEGIKSSPEVTTSKTDERPVLEITEDKEAKIEKNDQVKSESTEKPSNQDANKQEIDFSATEEFKFDESILNENNVESSPTDKEDDILTDEMLSMLSDDTLNLDIKDETTQTKPIATSKGGTNSIASVQIPVKAKDIFARYPSFITTPLLEVFKTTDNEKRLKEIDSVIDSLTAYLNICFLQSCLFYATESEMLARCINECIKQNLTGHSALRCLHNFAMAMKTVRANPTFFTFPLSKILCDSSDENPLMMMRELKEFLKEPEEPLSETIPQAVDGLIEILLGVRTITLNNIVMRSPAGAKEPYADLSGPSANILPVEKRPSVELPTGEAVVISKDGTEGFGLFPFFKYSKKKLKFAIPTTEEVKLFNDRLNGE